jgi:hypothetical protein
MLGGDKWHGVVPKWPLLILVTKKKLHYKGILRRIHFVLIELQ